MSFPPLIAWSIAGVWFVLFVLVVIIWLAHAENRAKAAKLIEDAVSATIEQERTREPGYVYIMRREDGVYKVGCTDNVKRRIKAHEADYGVGFDNVRFWLVPNKVEYEKRALKLTRRYAYWEGKRRELRQMTDSQLLKFVKTFGRIVQEGRDG